MSLLEMAGQFLGGQEQGGNQNIISEVVALVNNHPGGLEGLVQAFQQGGLGEAAQSSIGNGPNQPVSGEQMQNVLGQDRIQLIGSEQWVDPHFIPRCLNPMHVGGVDSNQN